MTLSDLRSLHAIIGRAIADIEQVYATHSSDSTTVSPSPSPKNAGPTSGLSYSHQDQDTETEPLRTVPTSSISTHISTSISSTSTLTILKTQTDNQSLTPTPPESECGCDIDDPDQNTNTPVLDNPRPKSTSKAHISTPPALSSPYKSVRTSSGAYASPPPSPLVITSHSLTTTTSISSQLSSPTASAFISEDHHSQTPMIGSSRVTPGLDFPSLDAPYDAGSLSEMLTTHPRVLRAIQKIVAASGQLMATAQTPFLTLCEAVMAYHLPSCMRLLEASHVVEILREAGPDGLSVKGISKQNGVTPSKLAHVLRLLATHHLLREVSPDVFALNRVSSLVDTGKTIREIKELEIEGRPEAKFMDTNGIAAFVGLCTDEIQKSSAYLTETYLHPTSTRIRAGTDPAKAPFAFAFAGANGASEGFFGWLESGGEDRVKEEALGRRRDNSVPEDVRTSQSRGKSQSRAEEPPSRFRLERFGKAMAGTDGWEVPGAVLTGFDWAALPHGSVVVDVGGGIGSTSMILATAFSVPCSRELANQDDEREGGTPRNDLKFVIQDRGVVCEMGEKAWKAKCPELLGSSVTFQVHDFFTPQPIKDASVFLLRVVLHDWPDVYAREILLRLREATGKDTKLLIADFVLPLACVDREPISNADAAEAKGDEKEVGIEVVEVGGEGDRGEVESPLLPNLGKASANGYWMDLTMQVMFNAQERTLREMDALTRSAGWRIVRVTKTPGSMFGYLVAVPVNISEQEAGSTAPSVVDAGLGQPSPLGLRTTAGVEREQDGEDKKGDEDKRGKENMQRNIRAATAGATPGLRCGTPTFGSGTRLSSAGETLAGRRFGSTGRVVGGVRSNSRKPVLGLGIAGGGSSLSSVGTSPPRKKKPSPLSVQPTSNNNYYGHQTSPSPAPSPRSRLPLMSTMTMTTTMSPRDVPPLPPRTPVQATTRATLARRMSLANLRGSAQQQHLCATFGPPPPLPVPLNSNANLSMSGVGNGSSSGSSTARPVGTSSTRGAYGGSVNVGGGGYVRPRRASYVGSGGLSLTRSPSSGVGVPPVPRLHLNTTTLNTTTLTTTMRNVASPVSPNGGSRPSSQFSGSRRDAANTAAIAGAGGGMGLSSPGVVLPRSAIARRASTAQLRTRGGALGSQNNINIAGPQLGGVLRFEAQRGKGGGQGHVRAGSMVGLMGRSAGGDGNVDGGLGDGVGVLAAAARIESGRSYEGREQASP